jgi:carotenoid 1,2-hydratase
LEGVVRTSGIANPSAGSLPRGRQRPSGTGSADGGAVGPAGSGERDGGPEFDQPVEPGGYAWWYVDALSDDGQHGLAIIALVGSVFSPYYAWSGRRDPLNHCAVNVALYGPRGNRWAMTERGRNAVFRGRRELGIGSSALSWDGSGLTIDIDEVAVPVPHRIRGAIRVEPTGLNRESFSLDATGRHLWRPIAPSARVSVELVAPDLRWNGEGYFDMNAGCEPLEAGFADWTWSRAALPRGSAILYDAERRQGERLSLALRFDKSGRLERLAAPPIAPLPTTGWRLARRTRSDDGAATVTRSFEDTPFYARACVSTKLFGENVTAMHESLSLVRFANPLVRLMLPFRMPRRG